MTKELSKEKNHAIEQAQSQLDSVRELVQAMRLAFETNDQNAQENAVQAINQDALCIEVRVGWHQPGAQTDAPREYNILLCTGGPACRVIGDLNDWNEPETARIEYQDWGTPWEDFPLDGDEEADVLEYARQFYFGE